MSLLPTSTAVLGGILLASLPSSVLPVQAAPAKPAAKPATKPAAKVTPKPAVKPAPVESAADKASAARGKALIKQVEDQLAAAKTITMTSVVTGSGAGMPAGSTTIDTTMQRPNELSLSVAQDGKDVGKVVLGADGGTAYDAVKNRYSKIEKSTTIDPAFQAAQVILPQDTTIGLYLTSMLISRTHPILVEPPAAAHINVKVRAIDETLNNKPVIHVTQTIDQGERATTIHLYVDKDTSKPVRFGFAGSQNGKVIGNVQADFSKFDYGTDVLPETAFQYTPPAAAVAFTPPAQPEEAPILANGAVAPDFAVQDVKGHTVHLADFAGKVVVIDFWSTWCGPCQQSLPGTDKIAKKYASKGVVFLPVCSWDEKSAFTPWVNKHKTWTMTFYFDPAGRADTNIAGKLYKVSGIPTQFVIGKDGKVSSGSVGYEGEQSEKNLTAAIDKALGAS